MPATEVSYTILRAARRVLDRLELWQSVSSRLSPAALAVLDPAPQTGWHDGEHYQSVLHAVHAVRGEKGLIQYAHAVTLAGVEEVRGGVIIQGLLRLFGPTPHALLARIDQFNQKSSRGVRYHYERMGERSARMTFELPELRDLDAYVFVAQRGVFEGLCELLGHPGRTDAPELVRNGKGNSASIMVRW